MEGPCAQAEQPPHLQCSPWDRLLSSGTHFLRTLFTVTAQPLAGWLPATATQYQYLSNQCIWNYKQTFFCLKSSYLKRIPGSESEKWVQVQGCERAHVTRCALPPDVFRKEIYLRVRASRGSSSSPWSREEKFDAGRQGKPVAFTLESNSSTWRPLDLI